MRLQLTFVILQSSRKGDRKAELLETLRSNCTLMNMVNELDGLTAQLSEPQTVDEPLALYQETTANNRSLEKLLNFEQQNSRTTEWQSATFNDPAHHLINRASPRAWSGNETTQRGFTRILFVFTVQQWCHLFLYTI